MRESQKVRILKVLAFWQGDPRPEWRWVHNSKLYNIAGRFGGRLCELRKVGIDIETVELWPNKKQEVYYRLNTPVSKIDFEKAKLTS